MMLTAQELEPLVAAAQAGNLDPLAEEIRRRTETLNLLVVLRNVYNVPPAGEVKALPPVERKKPGRKPMPKRTRPVAAVDEKALAAVAGELVDGRKLKGISTRLKIANYIATNGPANGPVIAQAIGLQGTGIYNHLGDEWFEKQQDGYHLSDSGWAAVRAAKEAA